MLIDFGLIRFLTKVAEKSPRGLKLVLFKEKNTGNEKMVFIVKTASEDLEKLALSKMTWQVEQNKASPKVIIVRLLILPDGAKDFFRSETGLLITEQKDYKCLQHLYIQKSIEIYFFSYNSEFHSKIELLTTPTMANNVKVLIDRNPFIDESKLIVKSDKLSEKDIQDAILGKVKNTNLKEEDILESLKKKMPTFSPNNINIPKTKPEEFSKTSIKSNDIKSNKQPNILKPEKEEEIVNNQIKEDNILDVISSIPPSKGLSADDLLNVISGKNEILSSAVNQIKEDNVLDVISSIPPDGLSTKDLLKSLSKEEIIDTTSNLSKYDLVKVLEDSKENDLSTLFSENKEEDFFEDSAPTINLSSLETNPNVNISNNENKKEEINNIFNNEEINKFFEDNAPTVVINKNKNDESKDENKSKTNEINADDLLLALMSEPSPIKEQENLLMSELLSQDSPLKSNPEIVKEIESNVKVVKPLSNTIPPNKNSSKELNELFKNLNNEK